MLRTLYLKYFDICSDNMVKELEKGEQKLYLCEACGFEYKDTLKAQQCEDYCNKHQSCSTEITKHAVSKCCQ